MATMVNCNKIKAEQTADPSKYPQGYFKPKACRCCKDYFTPKAPSELYCKDECKDKGLFNAYLKRNYKITYRIYHAMLDSQGHRCKICRGEGFIMNKDRHKLKLVVDHCHLTGTVRGLLCHNCNRALGLFKDNINSLQKAIDYLNV